MLEFIYKDSNNNSEFINEIIECIDEMIGNIYWIIYDLDIIANDREDFITNKPIFSEKVFNFENLVEREHGVYINTKELSEIIFESRTIRKAALACYKNDIPKIREYIPLVEGNLDNIKSTHAILEIRILDGDLIYIIGNESLNLEFIKSKFKVYSK